MSCPDRCCKVERHRTGKAKSDSDRLLGWLCTRRRQALKEACIRDAASVI